MNEESLNDEMQNISNIDIYQSFAKTLPCRYEDIKEINITGFTFKKEISPYEVSMLTNQLSPNETKVKSFISKMSNKEILYSGHFGPVENKKSQDDLTPPFTSIQEENLNQSFLTATSSNFTSFMNSSLAHQKSFCNLCKNITIDKTKKKSIIKSTEQLQMERIQQEKEIIKKMQRRNNMILEKGRNNISMTNNTNQSQTMSNQCIINLKKKPLINNNRLFLNRKRETSFDDSKSISKSKSKPKINSIMPSKTLKQKRIPKKDNEDIDSITAQLSCLGLNKSLCHSISPDETSKDHFKLLKKSHGVNTYQTSIRKAFTKPISTEQNQINEINRYKYKAQPLNKEMFKQKMNIVSFEDLMKQTKNEQNQINAKELKNFKDNRNIRYKQSSKANKANKENMNCN